MSRDEIFIGKVSSLYLVRIVYSKCGLSKSNLKTLFLNLCEEYEPLISKAAALEFGPLCKIMNKEIVLNEMIEIFKKFIYLNVRYLFKIKM